MRLRPAAFAADGPGAGAAGPGAGSAAAAALFDGAVSEPAADADALLAFLIVLNLLARQHANGVEETAWIERARIEDRNI